MNNEEQTNRGRLIHFKSQKQINDERRRKMDNKLKAFRARIEDIKRRMQ